MSSTIELTEDEYAEKVQAAVDKALKKQARAAEVDALKRIEAAKLQAIQSVKNPSPHRPTSLFQRSSSRINPSTPSMAARSASPGSTQRELEEALNLRVAQQQSQEVTWNKRAPPKASTASVTLLLSDYDIYKKQNGLRTLHECCGKSFLTLLAGVMQIEVPDATDGDDPLRTLLEDTFETQDTFQIRFKSACKGLAMVKGRKANIEDLQVYLSDFYELVQGFADRGQIADPDDPDFNVNLIDYFMSNVEPLEMRTKMQEFKVTTFVAAIKTFQSYLRPDTISLVNNIRDRNLRARAYEPFVPTEETHRKAAIAHDTGITVPTVDKPFKQVNFCDNCTRHDGSPGMHMTKNCQKSPCKKCLALDNPSDHHQRLCPLLNGPTSRHVKQATAKATGSINEKGARPPWRPPKTTPYDYHRYADERLDCLAEDQEDDIPYDYSDDDGC